MSPQALVWLAVSAGVAALLAAALCRFAPRPWAERLAGVALAVGYAVAHFAQYGLDLSPSDVTHLLPHVALLAGAAGLLERSFERWPLRVAVLVVVSAIVGWLLLGPVAFRESTGHGVLMLALAVAGLCAAQLLAQVATRDRALGWTGLQLAVFAAGAAAACALSASLVLGLLGGAVAAGLGGVAVASRLGRERLDGRALATTAATLIGAVALLGFVYAEIHWQVLALLAAMPLGAALASRFLRRYALALALALSVVFAAGAAGRAYSIAPLAPGAKQPSAAGSSESEYDYGYGYD